MHLQGSCHCGSVKFSLESEHPVPFMRCYCSICRKTAGGGGFSINLGGSARSMKVQGKRHLRLYRALVADEAGTGTHESSARRYFCARCGSALWVWDPTWPELVHPHASAIDAARTRTQRKPNLPTLKVRPCSIGSPSSSRGRRPRGRSSRTGNRDR